MKNYNLTNFNKLLLFILILSIILVKLIWPNQYPLIKEYFMYDIFQCICIISSYFIFLRINDLRVVIGIINSIMFNYLNGPSQLILNNSDINKNDNMIFNYKFSYKYDPATEKKNDIIKELESSLTDIIKIQIYDNEITYFLFKLIITYKDHFNNSDGIKCDIKTNLKFSKLEKGKFSSSKLTMNWFLFKEFLKVF